MKRTFFAVGLLCIAGTLASSAQAQVTRTQALTTGRSFAHHRWSATTANVECSACPSGFDWSTAAGVQTYRDVSAHYVGDFEGLPYNWGGHGSLREFDEELKRGFGAGAGAGTKLESPESTTGVDCSGFVTQVWRRSSQVTTRSIPDISSDITVGDMKPGDVWNMYDYHVSVFTQTLSNGIPEQVESLGYNVNINRHGGWAGIMEFVPRRYQFITGEPALPTSGTLESPTVIQPNGRAVGTTKEWPSSVYSLYNCAPGSNQSGPEVFYQVTFDRPGTFTASIVDDASTDVDVHILSQKNTESCVARDNLAASSTVGCGTYYIVVDTFGGAANAGAFTLTTAFTPTPGAACGDVAGPKSFEPKGAPGQACASEATPNEPAFCDINLGAEACLSGDDFSFCSMPCEGDADCSDMAGGAGCCGDVTVGSRTEKYCYAAAYCEGGQPSSSGVTSGGNGTSGSSGRNNSGGTSGGDDDGSGDDDTAATSGGKKSSSGSSSDGGEGGCAASPGTGTSSSLLLVGLGLVGLAARRRARQS